MDTLSTATNNFGYDLLNRLAQAEPSGNVFVSPLSIALALAMTSVGATGATLDEFKKVIEHAGPENQVKDLYKRLLDSVDGKKDVALSIANSLWLSKTILPQYVQDVATAFHAEAKPLTDAGTINGWVSSKTHGMITKLLDRVEPDTILILVNAIYFKGAWSHKFNKARTAPKTFYGPTSFEVQMMYQSEKVRYMETSSFQMVTLPYGTRRQFGAAFLLPKSRDAGALNALIGSLNDQEWKRHVGALAETKVELFIPRLKLEFEKELKEVLKAQGLNKVFTSEAELTNITNEPAFISAVIHKAVVELDEEGTTAAAATAAVASRGCKMVKEKVIEFVADHPFVFAIFDNSTHSILFLGKIVKPH